MQDLYVSVWNDHEFGGVLQLRDGHWTQLNEGLGQAEVFDLERSPEGQLVAATNRGLYRLDAAGRRWEPSRTLLIETKIPENQIPETKVPENQVAESPVPESQVPENRIPLAQASEDSVSEDKVPANEVPPNKAPEQRHHGVRPAKNQAAAHKPAARRTARSYRPGANLVARSTFAGRTYALALGGRRWYAATADGILISCDQGRSWIRAALYVPPGAPPSESQGEAAREIYTVSAHGRSAAASSLRQLWYSSDEGEHWWLQPLPAGVERIYSLVLTGDGRAVDRHPRRSVSLAARPARSGAMGTRAQRPARGRGEVDSPCGGLPLGRRRRHGVRKPRRGRELAGAAGHGLRGDRRLPAGRPSLCGHAAARGLGTGDGDPGGGAGARRSSRQRVGRSRSPFGNLDPILQTSRIEGFVFDVGAARFRFGTALPATRLRALLQA